MTSAAALGLVLSLAAGAPPQVTVTTLSGEQKQGTLAGLTREAIRVAAGDAEQSVPPADAMEVRFAPTATPPASFSGVLVTFADGSRLAASKVTVAKREATVESPAVGTLKLPVTAIASLRYAPPDQQVDPAWNELADRQFKEDMLVIRKGEVLDHLDGAIADVDETNIHFLLDNEDVPVKREKVFGVIYARRKPPETRPFCEATFVGGDRVQLRTVSFDGTTWKGSLVVGGEATLAPESLSALDFSLGKVKQLADLDWREMKFSAYWDTDSDRALFSPRKDKDGEGGRLRVAVPSEPGSPYPAPKTFARGLWLHSQTSLKYRLAGDYRRLQGWVGIHYNMRRYEVGNVRVKITGDEKPLFEADLLWTDFARPLDLDVTGVRDLQILVDYGRDESPEGDEVVLGDVKLVK